MNKIKNPITTSKNKYHWKPNVYLWFNLHPVHIREKHIVCICRTAFKDSFITDITKRAHGFFMGCIKLVFLCKLEGHVRQFYVHKTAYHLMQHLRIEEENGPFWCAFQFFTSSLRVGGSTNVITSSTKPLFYVKRLDTKCISNVCMWSKQFKNIPHSVFHAYFSSFFSVPTLFFFNGFEVCLFVPDLTHYFSELHDDSCLSNKRRGGLRSLICNLAPW